MTEAGGNPELEESMNQQSQVPDLGDDDPLCVCNTNSPLPLGRLPVDWEVSPDTEQLLLRLESLITDAAFWHLVRDRKIDLLTTRIEEDELLGIEFFLDRFDVLPEEERIEGMVNMLRFGLHALGIKTGHETLFSGYDERVGDYVQVLIYLDDNWYSQLGSH